jgi:hypothetical protein
VIGQDLSCGGDIQTDPKQRCNQQERRKIENSNVSLIYIVVSRMVNEKARFRINIRSRATVGSE